MKKYIVSLDEVCSKDISLVGGKNASLGEMIKTFSKKDINVPGGFALTSHAYWLYLKENKIQEKLEKIFNKTKFNNIREIQLAGLKARKLILNSKLPDILVSEIRKAYQKMGNDIVAVRSSAVCEDAPSASFAGQFETFLNISGEKALFGAIKKCLASSFNDRVIAYREEKKVSHLKFALSIGIQKMVRSDLASAGIMFSIDTETGFDGVVSINSIYGAGELIVKGEITPDEFYVFKPTLEKGYDSIIVKNLGRKNEKYVFDKKGGLKSEKVSEKDKLQFSLTEKEILTLAKWAIAIEKHYKIPQDIEWAKDGKTNKLFIVQSRPETVHRIRAKNFYEEYQVQTKAKPILEGIAIGEKIGQGKARVILDIRDINKFQKGEVLVTKMTNPDWMPAIRIASAVVTDEGSKLCHAAIVSRELGIPAIVGTKQGTKILKNSKNITVDCTQGLKGRVFSGIVSVKTKRHNLDKIPKLKTKIMMNVGTPDMAFRNSFIPNDGVGLAREEFIITEKVKIHPLALYHFEKLKRQKSSHVQKIVKQIEEITIEHKDKKEHFIKELAEGIGQIAAAFYPKQVIVRFSDFKINEYRNLVGGELFETEESNPMLGFRGACRYIDKEFQPAFQMECEAIKRCRNVFGLTNISVMVPFCRTAKEGKQVLDLMERFGLSRKNLKVYVMCEIPSNVILANDFLKIFDGMSIGSNDLTQLVLGLDRDNAKIAHIGDERDRAVKDMISQVIGVCRQKKKYSGICGEAPSSFDDFAQFLTKEGIESISLNPDTVIKTILNLSKHV